MVKKEIRLEGLDCANCAAKIEEDVNRLDHVSLARVNLITSTLSVEMEKDDFKSVLEDTRSIVKKHEPDVNVVYEDLEGGTEGQHSDRERKDSSSRKDPLLKEKISIALALAFFTIGFLIPGEQMKFVVYFISFMIAGYPVLKRAVTNIMRGEIFDENFLMSIATIGAFAIREYPEGAAVMIFYQVGELFQSIAVNHSRRSITNLLKIRPDYAVVLREGEEFRVDPKDVALDEVVVIRPGEKVPLDAVIIEGGTSVDTKVLTGESVPRDLAVGDEVLSGFINISGMIRVRVTRLFSESSVAKILRIVQEASANKAKTEQFITKFAKVYTPIVVLLAVMLSTLPPLVTGQPFSVWFYRALIFLVISCPCALVISIPLGFFGGIGAASKNGILVKGSNFLEALNDVGTVVFDKTGTLTEGTFTVTEVLTDMDKHEFMGIAALAEMNSSHPIARSVVLAYRGTPDASAIRDVKEIPGRGVSVTLANGDLIEAGNRRLVEADELGMRQSGSRIHVARNGSYLGTIIVSDSLKSNSRAAVAALGRRSIRTSMLTGDLRANAMEVAEALGIAETHYELMPEAKLTILESYLSTKSKTIFVGDGINDTPVLARADIGIAMGAMGSDAAIEAADIVIMDDEPMKLLTSFDIAAYTRKIVYQNIILAMGIKIAVMTLGALGYASMWQAVFADVGVAILAIINATRIMNRKYR